MDFIDITTTSTLYASLNNISDRLDYLVIIFLFIAGLTLLDFFRRWTVSKERR